MKHVGCSVSHTGSDAFSHALRRILFQPIPENAVSFLVKNISVAGSEHVEECDIVSIGSRFHLDFLC